MTVRVHGIMRGAVVSAVCAALSGGALAQTPTPAGELAARMAAEAPPPPPAPEPEPLGPPASCGAQNCLSLTIAEDALRALRRGVEAEQFAEGISFSYEGAKPPAVYLIAGVYENGRLTDYEVTPWFRPEPGEGLAVPDAAGIVGGAVDPLGEGSARVVEAGGDSPVWTLPLSAQGFMFDAPRTYLAGAPDAAPLDEAALPADLAPLVESGHLLLLALVPVDRSQRTPEMTRTTGIVAPLEYPQ